MECILLFEYLSSLLIVYTVLRETGWEPLLYDQLVAIPLLIRFRRVSYRRNNGQINLFRLERMYAFRSLEILKEGPLPSCQIWLK
jgi:hypothetical protein